MAGRGGKPDREGWHWLVRFRDNVPAMAYWHPHQPTRPMSDMRVRILYTYRSFVEPPRP